ncbi:chordin-like protein 2 isoform X2 [Oryctolagus cuniculus]|uniref:chordin-like protein 2 isoform X2 n=1 Tax=Oryctolagus cuniculus TaxID=9986 RepID=UPI002231955F|nr:chordin-like protein 2 isoform X2 [Oryctolagus cuniculus]
MPSSQRAVPQAGAVPAAPCPTASRAPPPIPPAGCAGPRPLHSGRRGESGVKPHARPGGPFPLRSPRASPRRRAWSVRPGARHERGGGRVGLRLGWPIHRVRRALRGGASAAPAPGRTAGFPRQSTNAPERGAWRPGRAQPARAQPPPRPPRRRRPAARPRAPGAGGASPARRAPQTPALAALPPPRLPRTFSSRLLRPLRPDGPPPPRPSASRLGGLSPPCSHRPCSASAVSPRCLPTPRPRARKDGSRGPDMFCLFHGKRYSPGESWHPYLEPQGLMYCLRCTCSESAHVNCYRLHCPPVHCPQPVTEPQQCCPRCVEPHTPSGLRAAPKSCQHNGTTYQHGEIFSAHELFPARLPNQCVVCSCTEGQIYCGLTTCPEPGCPTPLPLPDSCCQACTDGASEQPAEDASAELSHHGARQSQDPCAGDGARKRGPGTPAPTTGLSPPLGFLPRHFRPKGAGSTTVKIVLKEKHKKACVHGGKTYSHGEVWHPAFRSFGPLPCILCTCQDGHQDCQRVTCPTEYPCGRPEKVAGKCCKICPEDKADPGHSDVRFSRCPKTPGRVLVHTAISPSPDSLQRFALEHEASDQVDIYLWRLVKGIFHLIQIKRVRKQDFQKEAQNFRLLSGTHEGHWNIFLAQTPELKVTASPDKATKTL